MYIGMRKRIFYNITLRVRDALDFAVDRSASKDKMMIILLL